METTTQTESAALPQSRLESIRARVRQRAGTLESFQYRDYRWLWTSSFASFLAMNAQMIVRSWVILRLTDDSPMALAWVTLSFAIPMTVVAMIGGALADSIPRRRMMILGQSGNAVVTLVIATLDATGLIAFWHLMISGVLAGSMMAFNMPSRQAIISDIVPEDKLMNGIALANSGMNVTRILGPAIAGVLITYIGTWGVFYLIAAVYVLSVLAVLAVDAGKTPVGRSGRGMLSDIKEGFAYAAGSPTLLALIIMAFIPVLFGMSYYALLPAWAREALNVQSDGLGMLMMIMGIGALGGSLILAGLTSFRKRGALLLASCIVWGITLAAFSQTTSYAVAVPLLLIVGLTSSMFMALNFTLLQINAVPEMRGRIMSIAMMSFGVFPLSAVPFGILAEQTGTASALFLSGALLTAFTVVFLLAYPRFRRIP